VSHEPTPDRELGRGRWLRLVDRGGWEFAERVRGTAVACVVAITAEEELVLVEQFRPPLGRPVIELPAGVVGDLAEAAGESAADAARRELFEETGYEPGPEGLRPLVPLVSSAGLTSEELHVFMTRGAVRTGPGGGDATESIRVHAVPLADLGEWVAARVTAGAGVDGRVYAAWAFARMTAGRSD
jgi:ADP-ribose pyrophosphatase